MIKDGKTLKDICKNDKNFSIDYHANLKSFDKETQNLLGAKSPTRTLTTQSNHLFASILAYIKLEKLKFVNKMNHFALKTKIYNAALKAAFNELTIFKTKDCA